MHHHYFYAAALAVAAIALLVIGTPQARAGTWRLDVNVASYHTEAWAHHSLNERNPGAGLEYQWNRTWAVTGGAYSNSYRRPTVYALAEWTPLHLGSADQWHADAGLAAGLATGYRRDEVPCEPLGGAALVRVVAPDGIAFKLLGVPNSGRRESGFIGLQVSVPLDR